MIMKKALFICLIVLIAACSSDKKGNMMVSGQIKGLKKGTLYLQKMNDSALISVDSVNVLGKEIFTLVDNVNSPEMYYLTLNDNNTEKRFMFFGEPNTITITDQVDKFGISPIIDGSKNQKVMEDYRKMTNRFQGKRLDLIQAGLEADKENNKKRKDSIDLASERLLKRRYLYATNFAVNHGDFEASPYIALTDLVNANVNLLDTIYVSLSDKVKTSLYGKKLENFIKDIKENEKTE